jgi:MATE family multidrug resistance protein
VSEEIAAGWHEVRRLSRLAAPVVATQLGMMLLGVVDALMLGRVGVEPLAAAALGNVWIMGALLGAMGLVLGIDPIVSQAHGAKDGARLGLVVQQGLVVAVLVSIPASIALFFTRDGLLLLGQDPELARMAHAYAVVQIPGVAPFLGFIALRQYLQGRAIVMPAMWVMLLANAVNAALNAVLIFGLFGFPALGVVGSGIATALTRIFLLGALASWILGFGLHRGAWVRWTWRACSPRRLTEIARYGVPVAVQLSLEVWAFQIVTLMAGRLGATPLASHTIVINMASLSFMIPLGISIGAATRVGNLVGAGRSAEAQRAAWVALGMGAGVMAVSAAVFVVFRAWLPTLYTAELEVLALASALLPIAAAFQLFDGAQVVGAGILRGMGRTLPAAAFNLLAFYGLALPSAWWLAFERGHGAPGLWWGLCIGLGAVALMLIAWIRWRGPARVDARVLRTSP